jgi:penicillin-binding protein 2
LLVRNRPTYNITIIPAYLPDDATAQARIFARLSDLLDLPITTQIEPATGSNNGYFQAIFHHQFNRQLDRQIINPRSRQLANAPLGISDAVEQSPPFAPFLPVTIARDVDPLIAAKIEEERLQMPGVLIDISPTRDYLYGELLSHLLGYVGPIPAEQFDAYQSEGYDLTDAIGLAGLEASYQEWLRGIKGLENIEVDVTGQKIRTVSEDIKARPGHNLKLTIDLELQKATTQALQEEMDQVGSEQGVAMAMNPKTGEILALVSLPSFDNNLFSRGITARELSLLSEDPWTPLVNHAIAGLYPPGSIFKIIPAAGALQERTVFSDTIFVDEGILYLPNQFEPENLDLAQPFFCWLREGHGPVNMLAALAFSCDVYFYQVGGGYYPAEYEGLGLERMGKYAEMFGLGQASGIDLPGETTGLVPNQKWKRLNYAETWLTGDTYNMSIGQGFVLATPLQMLNAFAAIANSGILYKPYLVKEIYDADDNLVKVNEPQVIRKLAVEPQFIQLIQEGLRDVIEWEAGTAHDEFDVPGVIASGKTGTAEYCDRYPQCLDRDGRVKTSHAWFASYAPSYDPEIVTIVFVYGGGEGSQVAVPVTNKMLRHYFKVANEETDATAPEDTAAPAVEIQSEANFTARLLGTDSWGGDGASISGFVLDSTGDGVVNILVDLVVNDQVMAQVSTGQTGQFDFTTLDPAVSSTWQVRLPDYPNTPSLPLDIAKGRRYLVEFLANPVAPAETLPAE